MKARLDADRTAKPLTRLLATGLRPDNWCIVLGRDADTYEDLVTGERIPLRDFDTGALPAFVDDLSDA